MWISTGFVWKPRGTYPSLNWYGKELPRISFKKVVANRSHFISGRNRLCTLSYPTRTCSVEKFPRRLRIFSSTTPKFSLLLWDVWLACRKTISGMHKSSVTNCRLLSNVSHKNTTSRLWIWSGTCHCGSVIWTTPGGAFLKLVVCQTLESPRCGSLPYYF